MGQGSPIDRTNGCRKQAVEVGVPPITIIPSDPLKEFMPPVLESVSLKVLVPRRPILPSKDTVIIPVSYKL